MVVSSRYMVVGLFSLWNHLGSSIVAINCIICGKEFTPDKFHPKTVTCSRECCKKLSYQRHKSEQNSRYRNKRYFGGNRDKVLERDGYKCVRCGNSRKKDLIVHHIDGLGRTSEEKNNNMDNLQTLCLSCHSYVHIADTTWKPRSSEG